MATLEDIQAKAAELDRTLDALPPNQQAAVCIRSSHELTAILIRDCDSDIADAIASDFAERLDGVDMPTCIGAISSILATIIAELSKGDSSRMVIVGAVSGIVGRMMQTIDVIDEAAKATKQ